MRDSLKRRLCIGGILALLLCLGIAPGAQANRALISEEAVKAKESPAKQIEGACGVAVGPGQIYVSDYYHGLVNVFSGSTYQSQILAGTAPEGPCGLALSSAGALYANYYHQGVVRLEPSFKVFEEGSSTGVAVDLAGNLYINDRTYVAVYKPSGEPLLFEGQPLRIGLGNLPDSLHDGYGLAVSSFPASEGDVYVADAADEIVKVYEPATDPFEPSQVITGPPGGFNSLTDAALAIDPTNGHLLVADNLQPGFEHPEAAIDEFDSSGTFLGQLKTRILDAEPPGLAVDGSGSLYATSGNSEGANVFAFGPYTLSGPEEAKGPPGDQGAAVHATAAPALAAAVEIASGPTQSAPAAKKPHHKHHHRHHPKRKARK